ncbi:MAG: HPF/RaiA family ribosome-associated protein [Actinomycetota bacterium]|nr:HPF/RaiA family ribosome-associated protein [Actinomycetota bacterium]
MEIDFRARNVEVSDSVRYLTLERIRQLARALAMERADVCFWEERNPRIAERKRCEIVLFGHGRILRAEGAASDPAVAADRVVGQMAHRIEKLRGQLRGRRGPRRQGSVHFRSYQHLDLPLDLDTTLDPPCGPRLQADPGEPMTPEEAALEMAQLSHDFYFFTNAETERGAVVFKRGDGNVGLVEMTGPDRLAASGPGHWGPGQWGPGQWGPA